MRLQNKLCARTNIQIIRSVARYKQKSEADLFAEYTIATGKEFVFAVKKKKQKSWQNLILSVDNSMEAWINICNLNNDSRKAEQHYITAGRSHTNPRKWQGIEQTTQDKA